MASRVGGGAHAPVLATPSGVPKELLAEEAPGQEVLGFRGLGFRVLSLVIMEAKMENTR